MSATKEDDRARNEPLSSASQDVAFHADEIDLWDYFRVVWRHRYLVLAVSIFPTLIIGLVLFSGPRDYKLTYTYSSWELDDKSFEMFLDGFYSGENLDRIARILKNEGFEKYAGTV